MKKFHIAAVAAFAAVFAHADGETAAGRQTSTGGYVIAVDSATAAEKPWAEVVDALKAKRSATVLQYDAKKGVKTLLAELRGLEPRYICFVSKPEQAGRELVVSAAQLVREIDDDPYADALWGVLTGYEAGDAMKAVKLDKPLVTKRMFSSQGGPRSLDGWDAGFVSDEGNATNCWAKLPGTGVTMRLDCDPDSSVALAKAFNSIPVDIAMTSGHATEHNWQVIYNKHIGYLLHKDGNLVFRDSKKNGYRIHSPNPKIYMPSGNCLIGRIDGRDCMATAWMHSGGAVQMIGYVVSTFYGYMGWGTKHLYMTGAYSLSESFFLINQILLAELGSIDNNLVEATIDAKGKFDTDKYIRGMSALGFNRDAIGIMWDRDTLAFYGDPAWRASMPEEKRALDIASSESGIKISFKREFNFSGKISPGNPSWIPVLLDKPVAKGKTLVDAEGRPVEKAVVADLFALIPMKKGKVAAGTTMEWKFADGK